MLLLAVLAGGSVHPGALHAQESGRTWPTIGLALRGGIAFPGTDGQFFDLLSEQLSFSSSGLNGPAWGAEVSVGLLDRVDVLLGFERTSWSAGTRVEGGSAGSDATQNTSLQVGAAIYAGVRVHLLRSTWGPNPRVFVTGGAGSKSFDLTQEGVFPDAVDGTFFPASFSGGGRAFYGFTGVGVDVPIPWELSAAAEVRYNWGSGQADGDFAGLEPIDLAGLGLSISIARYW